MLKSKEIKLGDESITIFQLSALDNLEYMKAHIESPHIEDPVKPDDDADNKAHFEYQQQRLIANTDYLYHSIRLQALLIAYSTKRNPEHQDRSIEELTEHYIENWPADVIRDAYEQVGLFSKLNLVSNKSESSSKAEKNEEPIDPKL